MDLKVVFILTSVLISQVWSLMCNNCLSDANGVCHYVQGPCPDECASVRIAKYKDGRGSGVMNLKTCAPSAMCIVGSLNFGSSRVKVESICCTSDLCNNQSPPAYLTDISNKKRCYTCIAGDCSSTMECLGDEDRCVTSVSTEADDHRLAGIQKGCASSSICQQRDSSPLLATVADSLACCEGDLCNGIDHKPRNSGHGGQAQNLLFLLTISVAFSADLVS